MLRYQVKRLNFPRQIGTAVLCVSAFTDRLFSQSFPSQLDTVNDLLKRTPYVEKWRKQTSGIAKFPDWNELLDKIVGNKPFILEHPIGRYERTTSSDKINVRVNSREIPVVLNKTKDGLELISEESHSLVLNGDGTSSSIGPEDIICWSRQYQSLLVVKRLPSSGADGLSFRYPLIVGLAKDLNGHKSRFIAPNGDEVWKEGMNFFVNTSNGITYLIGRDNLVVSDKSGSKKKLKLVHSDSFADEVRNILPNNVTLNTSNDGNGFTLTYPNSYGNGFCSVGLADTFGVSSPEGGGAEVAEYTVGFSTVKHFSQYLRPIH